MHQHLAHIALVVTDYDEAIAYYTQKLHFRLLEDTPLSDTKRWVLIAPPGSLQPTILLAKSANELQASRVGNQTGGRVFLFLHTDDIQRDYQNLIDQQIKIVRGPQTEEYGTVLVFEDVYGNLWDLIQPASSNQRITSTAVLKGKDNVNQAHLILALKQLRTHTLLEKGVLQFDIKQALENPNIFVVWEQFKNQAAFESHLNSAHLQHFLSLDLVTLDRAYQTKDIH
ncbi:MAG: hypothetical protein RL699_1920 [Bacteroidota bacterium]|jgi:quinol monooxygenase YgiN/uncharacterized glyoxalase superfamily protein PhnB